MFTHMQYLDANFQKICPYCLEQFYSNHANRIYCDSKNGRMNYCKIHFDVQIKALEESERNSIYSRSPNKENYQRLFNIQVLDNNYRIGNRSISDEQFLQLNYDMLIFDKKEVYLQENFFTIQIGDFGMQWTHDNKISITKKH